MVKDTANFGVEEAVGKGDGESLGRKKHRSNVFEHLVLKGIRIRGAFKRC